MIQCVKWFKANSLLPCREGPGRVKKPAIVYLLLILNRLQTTLFPNPKSRKSNYCEDLTWLTQKVQNKIKINQQRRGRLRMVWKQNSHFFRYIMLKDFFPFSSWISIFQHCCSAPETWGLDLSTEWILYPTLDLDLIGGKGARSSNLLLYSLKRRYSGM